MDSFIEICDVKIVGKKTKIYIKGWVHSNNYSIVLKNRNNILAEFTGNESRYDISKKYHETIDDNNYGFEYNSVLDKKCKKIDVYLKYDSKTVLIKKINISKFELFMLKVKKFFSLIFRAIKLFWREYHFLVPPYMLKKYFNDFINKSKSITNENTSYYNQEIPTEYNQWIKKYEKSFPETKYDDITYLVLEKEKNTDFYKQFLDNDYYIIDKTIKDNLKKISTKYVAIISNDCYIDPTFYHYICSIDRDYDFIYFDNDFYEDGVRKYPLFKPNWSKDTILGTNYIGKFFIVSSKLIEKIDFSYMDIYSYILDIRDYINNPLHISKILYHCENMSIDQKNTYDNVLRYVKRNKISADVILNDDKETVSIIYSANKKHKISIIIPTKDHVDILKKCVDSIYNKSTYRNFEIVLIDNNSCEQETFDFFEEYQKKHDNFHVYRLECPFNYSYINNVAVEKYSTGDYVLLLNNDTEVITPNWLEIMLGYASLSDIGTVGAKLYFPDDTIQHAGIIMGKGGLAGHARYEYPRYNYSRQWELKVPYNVSGCTAACLMISKKKFIEVGMLEEKLQVAFNDVDFNLKVLSAGYRNIFLPNVELYHYESKSRGLDNTKEKQKRFMQEWQFMEDKWGSFIKKDNFYNENFSMIYDYVLDNKEEKND